MLCIPGDCPALDPESSTRLLDARRACAAAVAIVPDRHGTGTNGLLLTPPDAIAPSFGPAAVSATASSREAAGARCRIERPASLLLDIDTGEDLAALRERLAGERAHAPAHARRARPRASDIWQSSRPAA